MGCRTVQLGFVVAVFFATPHLARAEAVDVDVSEWVATETGVTLGGWTVRGVDSYADDGSARFNSNDDFAQSPVFAATITQVTMRVKSSSLTVTRILTISPVDSEGSATVHKAEPTVRDRLTDETFAWSPSEGVHAFRLQNDGVGSVAGWGIAALTVYTDRIGAPPGLRDDAPYRDAFLASWDGVPGAGKYQIRYARYETVAAWNFSVLTNTSGNTVDLPKLKIPESLGTLSGTNVCLQGHAGGHIQIGKGEQLGCLVLPMPSVAGDGGAMTGVLCAWKYPKTGKPTMPLYYIADGETNDLATVELTDERAEYRFPVPAGFAAESILLSSATNGIALADQNGRVRVEGFAIVSGPAVTGDFKTVGSAGTEKLVRGLSPGTWAWSARAFDAKGVDSSWSAFRSVTLDASKPPLVPPGALLLLR